MISFLESLGPFGIVGFIGLQVLQVVVAPIPGEVTGLIGGYLYGPVIGVIWSTIGLTIGSYIAFALARYFGRPFVDRFVDKSILKSFEYLLHHKGVFLVFLLFLIPGTPKDYLCYVLGLGHLTTAQFLVITGVGRLFGTILLTVGGDMIRHEDFRSFAFLVGITIIVVIIILIFRKKIKNLFRKMHISSYKKDKKDRSRKNKPKDADKRKNMTRKKAKPTTT